MLPRLRRAVRPEFSQAHGPVRFNPRLVPAVRTLRAGGVVAYPTEGVFGIGCRCDRLDAIRRIIALKRRAPNKGLIVIVDSPEAATPFVTEPSRWLPVAATLGFGLEPVTCVFPASSEVPPELTGGRASIALRVVQHPIARHLCRAAGPLVSTSANLSGRPPARTALEVRLRFGNRLDGIVHAPVGSLGGPTPLYDLVTGRQLR